MSHGPDILDSGDPERRWWGADAGGAPLGRDNAPAPRSATRTTRRAPRRAATGRLPAEPAADPWRARRRVTGGFTAVLVVVALVVGAAGGVAFDRRLREQADDVAAGTQLAVRLEGIDRLSVSADPTVSRWSVRLLLRNDAARPVRILDARADAPAVATDPFPAPVPIGAGQRVPTPVSGTVDCGALDGDFATTPPRLSASVTTADGVRHAVDLGTLPTSGAGLLSGCQRGRVGTAVAYSAVVQDGVLTAQLAVSNVATGRRRIVALTLSPDAGFAIEAGGLPLLLDEDALGYIGARIRVTRCSSALAFDATGSSLVLRLVDGTGPLIRLPVPLSLATALVRLSEQSCRR